jgi:hypothetical protein
MYDSRFRQVHAFKFGTSFSKLRTEEERKGSQICKVSVSTLGGVRGVEMLVEGCLICGWDCQYFFIQISLFMSTLLVSVCVVQAVREVKHSVICLREC